MKKFIFIVLILFLTLTACAPTTLTTEVNSPCQDPKLLELEKKDSLSTAESQMYIGLKQICEERKNAVAIEKQLSVVGEAQSYFMYMSALALAAAIIITVSNDGK